MLRVFHNIAGISPNALYMLFDWNLNLSTSFYPKLDLAQMNEELCTY